MIAAQWFACPGLAPRARTRTDVSCGARTCGAISRAMVGQCCTMPPRQPGGGPRELTAEVCVLLREAAQAFHGAQRRRFMAETVAAFGLSQRRAERQRGWARDTIRKAQHELHSGITCADNFSARGRKPAEFHLPHLLPDLCDRVRDHLQTDPTFQEDVPLAVEK